MSKTGVISIGVKTPIIRQGDNLQNIVIESVEEAVQELGMTVKDGDIIGITESVVARSQGNYVTVDDVAQYLREHGYLKNINLCYPIMSRNRFSIILRGIARYCDNITIYIQTDFDTQGDPTFGINPYTGVDIQDYYKQICAEEKCNLNFRVQDYIFVSESFEFIRDTYADSGWTTIDARCHPDALRKPYSLAEVLKEPVTRNDGTVSGYNPDWGVLGSNKATDESLKLFPNKSQAQKLVDGIQDFYKNQNKHVEVLVYGDGCFKSPEDANGVSIWEFADPQTYVASTNGIPEFPNEIKVKNLADDKYKNLSGKELDLAIEEEIKNKNKDLKNNMLSQGTTPRNCKDLLVSLMDLTSGSGDRCTPIVYIHGYF